ncbi:MAG TPA: alpha/beta hydrolase [Longimicrobiales bacterium]|nr:alpha/beta hydrolase [Longimicrobiales bacterium]
MNESWVRLGDRRVRYVDAGAGPPIIFAAGLGISADFYKPNMAALVNAGFRAIAPDLPGFGKTHGPFWGADVRMLTQHLTDFATALNVRHAGWIGHSLGCQPLLRLAGEHPELVRALVLAGPTGGYDYRLLKQVGALASAAVQEPWRLLKAVLRDYVRLSPFNYLGAWIKARRDDPLIAAKTVMQPTLILVGMKDKVPQPDFLTNLSAVLNAEVIKLPGGNHGLPLDAQREFERECIRFFRKQL